jgi:hypothetical protein
MYQKQNQSHAVFAQQASPLLENQILDVVQVCVQPLPGVFHIQMGLVL